MRVRTVTSILRKELLETLRDRRTLFAMVALPAILYPLLFLVMGGIFSANIERVERQTGTVALWGPVPDEVAEAVSRIERPRVRITRNDLPSDVEAEARRLIEADRIHAVVVASPGADELLVQGGSAPLRLMSSEVKPLSQRMGAEVADVLDSLRAELLRERVSELDLPAGFEEPLSVEDVDVSTTEQRGGDFLGRMLPMLLLIMVTVGATYPAIDATAGEKERGTMQTLLVSPVRPVEVITGKYVSVLVVALMSATVNLLAMGFALGRMTLESNRDPSQSLLSVSARPIDLVRTFVVLIPTACLLAAILLGISVFARSFREGQTYATPVMIVAMMAGFVAWSDIDLSATMAFVPLMNVSLLVRDLFRQELAGSTMFIVFLSTSLYALAAILATARIFESEQVLLSGERPWRDIRFRRAGGSVPSGRAAALFAVVLLVLVYYGSLFAPRMGFVGSILLTQLGLLLVPALAWVAVGRHSFRQTLSLRAPRPWAVAGILLAASGGWAFSSLVARVASLAFPGASDYYRSLGELIGAGTRELSLVGALALLALLPAVTEEVCFRGVVLSGLRSTGTAVGAVIASSLLFGAFHMSLFHAIPAAAIGVVLALVVMWSGSLAGGVAIHLVNNTIAVVASREPELIEKLDSVPAITVGLVLLVGGLVLIRTVAKESDPPEGGRP